MYFRQADKWLMLFILMLSGSVASANLSLKESMAKGLVSLKAISNGGYMGKCLNLELHNNTNRTLALTVDPALIFRPADKKYQPLVAVGEEQVVMGPGQQKTVTLQTFCGKSNAAAPARNISYTYWKQGDTVLRLVSHYIKTHGLFSSLGQHAVWTLTDKHCLSNVYNPAGKSSEGKALVTYMAGLLHQQVPEYYTYHKINTGNNHSEVFDLDISRVYVDLNWNKESRRNMHVVVFDHNRKVYRNVESGQVSNSKGEHDIKIEFDPERDPLGVYYVQLRDDENTVLQEKRVVMQRSNCIE